MSVVIVGGDKLGTMDQKLYAIGVTELRHISGRKHMDLTKVIPRTTDLVVVLTDYVNHNMARNVKMLAKTQEIPLIFAKRSWVAVAQKLGKQVSGCGKS